MYDYNQQIYEFVKQNFTPAYPDLANIKFTTGEFLGFLFDTFPDGCISDYELNEILLSLDFERFTYSVERVSIKKGKDEYDEDQITITPHLVNGWCLHSEKLPINREKR